MMVGYARTSTVDQEAGFDAQLRDLAAAGCERVFSEKVSSVAVRPQMLAALAFLRAGDTLVVTKPDRLARSTLDLLKVAKDLKARKIGLRILSMGLSTLDQANPTTALMLSLLASVAEFEREIMLERQREGIARAKADGKYKGRAPTVRVQTATIRALQAGGTKPAHIARQLGIARSSVYRMLEIQTNQCSPYGTENLPREQRQPDPVPPAIDIVPAAPVADQIDIDQAAEQARRDAQRNINGNLAAHGHLPRA